MKTKLETEFKTRVKKVTYHRNGVGGTGFFCITFTMNDDGNNKREMVATIEEGKPESVRVLSLDDVNEKWRGDRILTDIGRSLGVDSWSDPAAFSKVLADLAFGK